MKPTENPVILLSAGTSAGGLSRQTALSELYAQSLVRCHASAVIDGGGNAEQLAERMDGLILSGGGDLHPSYYGETRMSQLHIVDKKRDEREWALLRAFCERKKPILGICRGIQLIDVYFGGTLFRHLGTAYLHDGTLHTVVTSENSLLRPLLGEQLPVNSYHHQAIRTLGEGLRVAAVSDADGVIEAIEHESLPILAVQWHPERMIDGLCMDTDSEMTPLFLAFLQMLRKGKDNERNNPPNQSGG